MKILLIQDYLRSGGTERQACLLSRAFADRGHDTTLLTFRPGGALAGTLSPRVTWRTLQPIDLKLDGFAPGLVTAVRAVAPEVVLFFGRMANARGEQVARALPKAVTLATLRTGKPLSPAFRRSLHAVTHIVANSRAAQERALQEEHLPAERISVIHNGLVFPPASGSGGDPEFRRQHGAGDASVVLLWVGMFRPEKHHRDLIALLPQLPAGLDWRLWLAGDGPTRADCERLVGQLGLRDRVSFFGFTSDPGALYRSADVAVLTSRSESLSNFLIEAHAHGVPSVAYAAQGVVECGGQVVPVGDSAAFLNLLRPLLVDRAQRQAESQRVRTFARKAFAPEAQIEAYLDLFRRLRANAAFPSP